MADFTAGVTMVELASGVFARLHEGLTNAGIIIADEGVLVIDSLRVPSFARDLISDIERLTDKPVRYVVDTHSHWDHSWGNEEFAQSVIVGHANCRAEMLDAEFTRQWLDRLIGRDDPYAAEAKTVRITPPTLTFDQSLQLQFGGRQIDLRYLGRAHTSGDTFVHLPEERLVFTGDVVQDRGVPYVLDGYLHDWVETDNRLVALGAERFVSGHGPVGGAPALGDARDFIAAVVASIQQAITEGRDEHSARLVVIPQLAARFGDWRGIERMDEYFGFAYRQLGTTTTT